ncbi:MAG: AI-2E family transporter [Candidatus Roizmanbacteria bacterium]|nr:AI-2E family transporter [Candidatus Roizmanbacteria bacterium]
MEKSSLPTIEISVKTILIGIATVFFLRFAWDMKDLLFSLFIAYIVMSTAKQPVGGLVKKGVSRGLAVFFVFLSFFISIGFLFSWVIPPFVSETALFINHFPRIVENVKTAFPINMGSFSFTQYIPTATNNFIAVITSIFSNAAFFVSTVFFSIYLTLDSKILTTIFSRFTDKQQLEKILKIETRIEKRLGQWLLSELFLMTIIGITTYIGLLLLGVKYALPLGIIAGLLEAIPNIGPTIAAVPAFFVGFSQYPLLGLFTVIMSIAIQQFENHLIVPIIMKRVVGIHPILTLIVLVIGGRYGGVLGALFAIPLTLVIDTIITGIHEQSVNNR